jgi:tRNA-Thr(GGU) m(6)t(6)A37 methyltransferase TsaA
MNLEPIGVVRNLASHATDENWGAVVSEVRLKPEFSGGLSGLDGFSHALVVFLMHQARFDPQSHLLRRPRDREDMPLLGIFAQRAKHRPNPIGVTVARIVKTEPSSLFVEGLDAIDGTPVLDIKPHVPVFDAPGNPWVAEWMDRLMSGYF